MNELLKEYKELSKRMEELKKKFSGEKPARNLFEEAVDDFLDTPREEIKYKHFRDNNGYLVATLCKISTLNGIGIGVAICSDYDMFSRKIGREISCHRARVALLSKRMTMPIRMRLDCINLCDALGNAELVKIISFPFKSLYFNG